MKAHYRVVVIGGGVVGASVLYHLTKLGWTRRGAGRALRADRWLVLARRRRLHALNANPNMALLQAYRIDLLKEVEAESASRSACI